MANLKLLILGPVRLEKNNGERLGRLGAKVKALLAYLATQPNGCAGRDVLAELLWDGSTQAEARHSLRQALLTLRAQLGTHADAVLKSDRDSLQLRLDSLDVDLLRFERAIRSSDDRLLMEACSLWRGSFCDGLDVGAENFETWLLRTRARLDELAAVGFERTAALQLSAGRFEAALSAAQQRVAVNPFDDLAHAALIDLYQQRGWVGPARAAYRRCVELFQRELGEVPDRTVEKALSGPPALERFDNGVAPHDRGTPALPEPEGRLPSTRRAASFARDAKVAALATATTLALAITINAFFENRAAVSITPPPAQASASAALMKMIAVEAHVKDNIYALNSCKRYFLPKNGEQEISMNDVMPSFSKTPVSASPAFYPVER